MADVKSTARIKFDDFTRGDKGVVIDPTYNTVITDQGFYQARDSIADTIQTIFEDIQDQTTNQLSSYYIGVTKLRDDVDPLELRKWNTVPHLYEEWEDIKQNGCGQDGLIVLATVSDTDILNVQQSVTVDEYSVALCQQLLHLFKIVNKDSRVYNKDFNMATKWKSGNTMDDRRNTSVIFMAVTLM